MLHCGSTAAEMASNPDKSSPTFTSSGITKLIIIIKMVLFYLFIHYEAHCEEVMTLHLKSLLKILLHEKKLPVVCTFSEPLALYRQQKTSFLDGAALTSSRGAS